jgi:hypothetical protein
MSPMRRASAVVGLRNAIGGVPDETVAVRPAPPEAGAATVEPPPRPETRVRFTLDLDRDRHRFLKRFALDAEVDAARVMKALLDELRDDHSLADRVRGAVWKAKL